MFHNIDARLSDTHTFREVPQGSRERPAGVFRQILTFLISVVFPGRHSAFIGTAREDYRNKVKELLELVDIDNSKCQQSRASFSD